jgi:GTPase
MKFIDEAKIYVKAGDGGRGCVSFRREKFVPRGGPNGGDGGKGGDVIVRASAAHRTLLDLKYRQHHRAKHGAHGEGSNRTGRNSASVVITVPVGTVVTDADTSEVLADLTRDGQTCIVARGGLGGRGNARFASSVNQAPRFAQGGIAGEERWLRLELKLLADVGIIGLPNVGKSTFIAKVSAARPKVADYPFTTLVPHLGVVKHGNYEEFVIADIPGLIRGAHAGQGMGYRFLRHIERTEVLLHILDISGKDPESAWDDFAAINEELSLFNPSLLEKPQVVGLNKIDLLQDRERLQKAVDFFQRKGIGILTFSAVTGEGIHHVIEALARKRSALHRDQQPWNEERS